MGTFVIKTRTNGEFQFNLQAGNDKLYFNLKATNGQVIGVSEMYESESGRDNGIESVKKNAAEASVKDQTV